MLIAIFYIKVNVAFLKYYSSSFSLKFIRFIIKNINIYEYIDEDLYYYIFLDYYVINISIQCI